MNNFALSPGTANSLSVSTDALGVQVGNYILNAKSENTIRAYRSDWQQFASWCANHGLQHLPASPETVAMYIADQADKLRVSSITRKLAAISVAHQTAQYESPTATSIVRTVMQGIRRTHGIAASQKTPALTRDIRAMVEKITTESLAGKRNPAILLIGFAGAMRRSEIVSLDFTDLAYVEDGLTVCLRRSKGDQDGEGQYIGIPFGSDPLTCPVRTMKRWLSASGITQGAIFRPINRHGHLLDTRLSGAAVAEIVKCAAVSIGKDRVNFGGHSLRSGLATSAAEADVPERQIMRQGRWKSLVVRRYIRHASLFKDNAATRIGL
jgi:site-specific recombinase XerD